MLQTKLLYEKSLWQQGIKYIGGVDEVGRGCIAGPIVGACVVWPQSILEWQNSEEPEILNKLQYIAKIKDSKKVTAKNRKILFEFITNNCLFYSISQIESDEIDKDGVGEANKKVLRQSAQKIPQIEHLLVDHFSIINETDNIRETSINKGDDKSLSIAAASILAKVHRDNLMIEKYDQMYPEYGFSTHVGYGTQKHKLAISKFGFTPIHRKSFKLSGINVNP